MLGLIEAMDRWGHSGVIGRPSVEEIEGYVRFLVSTGREIDFKLDENRMALLQVWVREGKPVFEWIDGVYASKTFGSFNQDLYNRIGRCSLYVKALDQFDRNTSMDRRSRWLRSK
jgi:hypothetical protein